MTMTDKRCVLLFVKLPVKGRVKSRLALHVGEDMAVRLYENMALDAIDTLTRGRFPFRICFTPHDAREQMMGWLGREYDFRPQTGDDLGGRMEEAFARVFSGDIEEALLIGSDIPGLSSEVLEEAFAAFLTNDVVIGPADDGGYYLIGFRKNAFTPGIFHDIAWSTNTVFLETMERLHEFSRMVHILPELTDLDTVENLKTFLSQFHGPQSESSRTLAYLTQHRKSILK